MTPSHKGIGRILDAHDFLGRDSGMCASGEFWTHATSSGGIRTYSRPILAKCRPKSIAASEFSPKIGGVQIPPDNALGAQMSPNRSRHTNLAQKRRALGDNRRRACSSGRATETEQLKQGSSSKPRHYRSVTVDATPSSTGR